MRELASASRDATLELRRLVVGDLAGLFDGPTTHPLDFEAPILALMGGADEGIPVEAVREFEAALSAAGVEHEVVIYEGAPHSFFDRKHEEFADDSAHAWRRLLGFVEQYTR